MKNLVLLKWMLILGSLFVVSGGSVPTRDNGHFSTSTLMRQSHLPVGPLAQGNLSQFGLGMSTAGPVIEWENTIGGAGDDVLYSVSASNDGGYILGGHSDSGMSSDKSENSFGGWDYWVVKLDDMGAVEWENTIGGAGSDVLRSVSASNDGGYILGGHSDSGMSSDKSENSLGGMDYWVVKLDDMGAIEWENTIGGTGADYLLSVSASNDGGYILGGYSTSGMSSDKSENNLGNWDYWVVKLDDMGAIEWENTIGGTGADYLLSVSASNDGGYILGGYSTSGMSSDKSESSLGGWDYWVVKLDDMGAIEWENTIGGTGHDQLWSVAATNDGGYILGGYSESPMSSDKSESSLGNWDYWVVKLDDMGAIEWENTISGTGSDYLRSVSASNDGGYILGGHSDSGMSSDKSENSLGGMDYWVVKLDDMGAIEWENTIGGAGSDVLRSVSASNDGGYILGGHSTSGMSSDKSENNLGSWDYWVVKLSGSCDCDPSTASIPTTVGPYTADCAGTDANDWTHYCDNAGNLLLSVKDGETLIADPADVTINIGTPTATYYNQYCGDDCFITNPEGAVAFCRTWDVDNTILTEDAEVRFYFTTDEYDAINTEISNQSGTPLTSVDEMWFYKATTGTHAKPDALTKSDVVTITSGAMPSTTNFVSGMTGAGDYYAEYKVASFSGGGGGGASGGASAASCTVTINGLQSSYCNNDQSFNINADPNIGGAVYSWAIEGGTGLTDNGNGTATIAPTNLTPGTYDVTLTCTDNSTMPATVCMDVQSFTIEAIPVVQDQRLEECETSPGSDQAVFDLTSAAVTAETGVTITYHLNATQASNATNPIASPSSYTSGTITRYARVEFNSTGCYDVAAIDLVALKAPEISFSLNSQPIGNINNEGTVDPAEDVMITVCDEDDNLLFTTISSSFAGDVSVVSTFSGTNIFNVPPDQTATLSDLNALITAEGMPGNVRLMDGTTSGTLVNTLTPFNDLNSDGILDPDECLGDPITVTIDVNAVPQISFTANGENLQSVNNETADASESATITVCDYTGTDNLTYSAISSDLLSGQTGLQVDITSSNIAAVPASPIIGKLGDINTTLGTMGNVQLDDATQPGTLTLVFTPFNDLNDDGVLDGGECSGDPVTLVINVNSVPQISFTANGENLQSVNNETADASESATITVCDYTGTDNLTYSAISSDLLSGQTGLQVDITSSNIAAVPASPIIGKLGDINTTLGTMGNVQLDDATQPGTLTLVFTPFNDLNDDGVLDGGECSGDPVTLVINVNSVPQISFTANGENLQSVNNETADASESATITVCDYTGTDNLTYSAISSDLLSGQTGLQVDITSSNIAAVPASPIIGKLGDINTTLGTMGNVQLDDATQPGTLTLVFTPFNDLNDDGVLDGGECSGDPVTLVINVNSVPQISFTANGENLQSVNNETADASESATITVCDYTGTDNLTYSAISSDLLSGQTGLQVDITSSNIAAVPASPIIGKLGDINTTLGTMGNVQLDDATQPGTLTLVFTPFNDLNDDGVLDGGECSGDAVTLVINVNAVPQISFTANGENLQSVNNETADASESATITVCDYTGTDNLTYSAISSDLLSGQTGLQVDITSSNIAAVPASPIVGKLGDINTTLGTMGNVQLDDATQPGTLTLVFTPFNDLNDDGVLDGGECSGDPVTLVINVNSVPQISFTANGENLQSVNNETADASESATITVCDYTGTDNLTYSGISSDLLSGQTGLQVDITSSNIAAVPASPIIGKLGDINTTLGTMGNVQLDDATQPGTLTLVFTPFNDLNDDGVLDGGECSGDPVTLVINVNSVPQISFTANGENLQSVNNETADASESATITVCDYTGTDNLTYSAISSDLLSGQTGLQVDITSSNITAVPVSPIVGKLGDINTALGTMGNVQLDDATQPGTLTLVFTPFNDLNDDGVLDGGECSGDPVTLVINVNAVPQISFTANGENLQSVNNEMADASESATITVCDYTGTDNLTYSAISSDLLSGQTGLQVDITSSNIAAVPVSPIVGKLGDINTTLGTMGNVQLDDATQPGTLTLVFTPFNDLNDDGVLDGGECSGDPVTLVINVNAVPQISFTANGENLQSVNNETADASESATITVCDYTGTDNLTYSAISSDLLSGQTGLQVDITSSNIAAVPASPIIGKLGDINTTLGTMGNVQLDDATQPGTLTLVFTPFNDLNDDGVLDGGECSGDPVTLVINVNSVPQISFTANGENLQSVNNETADASESATITVCDYTGTDNLTYSAISSDLLSGQTGLQVDITSSNIAAVPASPIIGKLGDINTTLGTMGNVQLDDATQPGTLTLVFTPFNDLNDDGVLDGGECSGDPVTLVINVNSVPQISFTANGENLQSVNNETADASESATITVCDYTGTDNLTYSAISSDLLSGQTGLQVDITSSNIAAVPASPIVGKLGDINTTLGTMGNVQLDDATQPGTLTLVFTPFNDLNDDGVLDGGECSGDPVTLVINVNAVPQISFTANGENLQSVNNETADASESVTITVCDYTGTDNLTYSGISSDLLSGQTGLQVDITSSNIAAVPASPIVGKLGDINTTLGTMGNVQLDDATQPGTLTLVFTPFNDLNDDGVLDGGECSGDPVTLVINVNAVPQISFTANGENLQSVNNETADASESATITVCDYTGTDNLTYSAISSDLLSGQTGLQVDITSSNIAAVPTSPIIGKLGDINTTLGTMGNVQLDDATQPGTLTLVFTPFNDLNDDGVLDGGECSGDPVTLVINVNAVPQISFTANGENLQSVNNETPDASESATITVCDYTGTDNLTYSAISSDLLSGQTGLQVDITSSNIAAVPASPIVGKLGDINTTLGTMGNVQLDDATQPGTLTLVFTPFNDIDDNGALNAEECEGDPVTLVINVYPNPQISFDVNGIPVANTDETYETSICSGADLEILNFGTTTTPPTGSIKYSYVIGGDLGQIDGEPAMLAGVSSLMDLFSGPLSNIGGTDALITFALTPFLDLDNDGTLGSVPNECEGTLVVVSVTVQPEPVGESPTPIQACSGETYSFDLDDYISNQGAGLGQITYVYDVTVDPDIGQLVPDPKETGAMSPDGMITNTIQNFASLPITITYTVTPTSEFGCEGDPFTVDVIINNNPSADILPGGPPAICAGDSRTIEGAAFPTASYDYEWEILSEPPASEASTLLPTDDQSPLLTVASDAADGILQVQLTVTNTVTGCMAVKTFDFTVNALPVVTCPSDFSVCVDANAVTLSGATPMGGEYSGTGVTEGSFDPSVAGVGEHTITYTYTDSETNCTNSCTFTITVDALPVVTCPSDFSVCVDANAVTLSGATPMGGEYSGTGVTEGSFDPSVAGVGEHTITYTYTDSETNCTNSCTFTITVDALPVVTCPSDFSVCVDANAVTLSGATPMGGEYSGTGVTEGSFDPSVAGVGEHTITYTYTDSETNCTNSCTFTITVDALPVVTCPSDFSVCVDANAVTLSGATPMGGEYSGTGVTEGSFDPSVAGVGEHTITYTYTDSETNCTNSCTFTITVNALPVVTCPSDFSVCVDANAVTLSGATPTGGEYSGTGVTEGSFDPSVAGAGEHTITYTYTDSETNCTNSCTFTITVNALPVVTCPSDFSVCVDANAVTLSGATPTGGEYSGTGVTEGSFDPSVAGAGEHTITYTYTDSETNCTNSCTFTITVDALPEVTCPSDFSVCVDANAVTLSGATPMGGEYSGTGVTEGSFDPSVAGVGEHTITYTYTDSETNCTNSCTFTITVDALP